jgi:hypothetical protein
MEFPVSRDELLAYKSNVSMKTTVDDHVIRVVTAICSGVMETVKTTDKHRFIYDATTLLIFQLARTDWREVPRLRELILNRIINELKVKFIDCRVIVDPLMKTITVSWEKQGPGDWHG